MTTERAWFVVCILLVMMTWGVSRGEGRNCANTHRRCASVSPPESRLPPIIEMPSFEMPPDLTYLQEYAVEIDGVGYLDISAISQSTLELPPDLDGIKGITALDGYRCTIENLAILEAYTLSKNLTSCKTLKNLTISGKSWLCNRNHAWSWLDDMEGLWNVDSAKAWCRDIKIHKSVGIGFLLLNISEGRQILERLKVGDCPETCNMCSTYLTPEMVCESHRVDCEGLNITEENLPQMPVRTSHLYLQRNQIRSAKSVFDQLRHLKDLTELLLGDNDVNALPYLDNGTFPKLNRLFMENNNIRELDVEAFKSIISRENLVISLENNVFACGCNVHFFVKSLVNVSKVSNLIRNPLRCSYKPGGATQLITQNPEKCETPVLPPVNFLPYLLAVLAVLNVIFIYLVGDLIVAIRSCHTSTNVRDPKIHVIIMAMKIMFERLFKKKQRSEVLVDTDKVVRQDVPVILRNHPTSSTDRVSFLMRTERRLTPGPS